MTDDSSTYACTMQFRLGPAVGDYPGELVAQNSKGKNGTLRDVLEDMARIFRDRFAKDGIDLKLRVGEIEPVHTVSGPHPEITGQAILALQAAFMHMGFEVLEVASSEVDQVVQAVLKPNQN